MPSPPKRHRATPSSTRSCHGSPRSARRSSRPRHWSSTAGTASVPTTRRGRRSALPAALVVLTALVGCATSQVTETGLSHRSGGSTAHAATVTHVSDGDTVTLDAIGKTRLIGIDTPEVYGHTECFGRAASAFTKRVLAPGTHVEYRLGVEKTDRYGRALAYVWLHDGRMFNGLLAEEGYATPLTIAPNVDYAGLFLAAARRARKASRGLWSPDTCSGSNPSSDHDCSDFRTHAQAQHYFDTHGGSATKNVENLDGEDHDGRVCETLP